MKIDFLFKYLKQEQIQIDENEFIFQFNSHPNYPSLLAISDTLTFFGLNNIAARISIDEIDKLPNRFIAKLKNNEGAFFSFVKQHKNKFQYTIPNNNKFQFAAEVEFKELWDNIVLLSENDISKIKLNRKSNTSFFVIYLLGAFFVLSPMLSIPVTIYLGLFYIVSIIGLFLAILTQKELLNNGTVVIDKLCGISPKTDCRAVLNSTKWKIFEVIGFGDLGIIFFSSQILNLFVFTLLSHSESFFQIQFILLLISLPILGLSIYFQKFVEKQWCPICISIICLVLIELFLGLNINYFNIFSLNFSTVATYTFVSLFILFLWLLLKSNFRTIEKLKEIELRGNRFKRKYKIFKNLLVNSDYLEIPNSHMVYGNNDAKLKISILTSPYCGHCETPHHELKSLVSKYHKHLSVAVIFSANPENKQSFSFINHLINIKLINGLDVYLEAMAFWYETKSMDKWLARFKTLGSPEIDYRPYLKEHYKWIINNNLNFTPCLFINGYKLPRDYKISELKYFIADLIEDKKLIGNNVNSGNRKAMIE